MLQPSRNHCEPTLAEEVPFVEPDESEAPSPPPIPKEVEESGVLRVKVMVGDIDPMFVKAIALPKLIFNQSNLAPYSIKEKSSLSVTFYQMAQTSTLIYKYAKEGLPGEKIKITTYEETTGKSATWTFHDATVWAIDFDTISFSQHYQSNNDFKCDFSFSKLDINEGE